MPTSTLTEPILAWYSANARDLPWRRPGTGAWAILVSEIMLQQTPVPRVLPAYHAWLERWPTPADLAAESPGEAVRQWGRLGYPRRALRLHAAATRIATAHGGRVPDTYAELRELPGLGAYTAAAVSTFAFGHRHAVTDTNVRRVLTRVLDGCALPPRSATAAETRRAEEFLPEDPATAARWSVAVMELGALVCTARSPRCGQCPVAGTCAWRLAGKPPAARRRPATQGYAGTDRQVRGRLLALLREAGDDVPGQLLTRAWDEPVQRRRALQALLADGLVQQTPDGYYRLPR